MDRPTLKTRLSDFEFVKLWLSSGSAEEAAEGLIGLKVESVNARANKLRKSGVNIPKFARKKQTTNIAGLNELIDDIRGQQQLFGNQEQAD